MLAWAPDDRIKLLAILSEDSLRCTLCGTAEYEWTDQYAFVPSVNVCKGCQMRENARDMAKDVPGGTIVLLSGAAKKEELARQREQYLASRKKSR